MSDVTCCMNVDMKGMSEWTVAFTRIWRVRDTYYGFNSTGMYRLSGPDDAGAPVQCVVTTSPNDFGVENLKRIPYARVENKGAATAELLLDDAFAGTAEMAATDNRAKFARGAKGRFAAFKVTSEDPNFYLYEIEPVIEKLQRGYR